MTDANRTRTITWQDPFAKINHIPEMSGMQSLQAILAGDIPPPPISQTLDFYLTAVTGKITCVGTVIHYGRCTATAEGKLLDENGKLLVHGTTSYLIFPIA